MLNLIFFLLFFLLLAHFFSAYCRYENESIEFIGPKILPLEKKSIVFIALIVLIPTLVVAFRAENIGYDTFRYIKLLNYPKEYLVSRMESSGEYLFWNICLFFQEYGNIRALFFVYAFVPLFFTFAGLYKLSKMYNPFISCLLFLLFFYHEFFNLMRQMPAIGLVFFSYVFCISRKFIPFAICILTAFLFHSSALIAFPLFFLYPRKTFTSWDLFKLIIFIVVVMFILSISLKSILFFQVFERYNAYLDSFYQVSVGQALASFFTSYFPIVLLMFFFSLNRNFSKNDKDFQFLWVVTFFFCAFIIMRFIETYFFRVAYYYQLGEILIISRICQKPSIKDNNGGLLTNYFLSEYDFLVVLVIIISFYIQLRMYDLSPLINYSIME